MTATREERQILPLWLTSWEMFERTVRFMSSTLYHDARFHGLRLPKYSGRLVLRFPVGLLRLVDTVGRWCLDPEGLEDKRTVRTAVGNSKASAAEVRKVWTMHLKTIAARVAGVALVVALVGIGIAEYVDTTDRLQVGSLIVLFVGFVGWHGRSHSKSLTDRPTSEDVVPRLTHGLIVKALRECGINELTRAIDRVLDDESTEDSPVDFVSEVMVTRNGHRCDFDVPGGITAAAIRAKRHRIASSLKRPASCVWPETDPDSHEGRCRLVVLDRSLGELDRVDWPGATDDSTVDIFEPQAIGKTGAGDLIFVSLVWMTGLIGAIPRMGKSFVLRLIAAICAKDDRVEIHAYDFKATGDLRPFQRVAQSYRTGTSPADFAYVMAHLRSVLADLHRRADVLANLPSDVVPESKITSLLASDPKLGLHPVLVILDEVHLLFTDSTYGTEAASIVHHLVTLGPAVGIMTWETTQKPAKDSIPLIIRDNIAIRICLRVQTQAANDMVLGQGMHSNGVKATEFKASDKGVGILVGDDAPETVKFYYADVPAIERVIESCYQRRKVKGLLRGFAIGQDLDGAELPEDRESNLVADVLAVWPASEEWLPGRVAAENMSTEWPDEYHGLTAAKLTNSLKPWGVRSEDHRWNGKTAKCYRRAALEEALEAAQGGPVDDD